MIKTDPNYLYEIIIKSEDLDKELNFLCKDFIYLLFKEIKSRKFTTWENLKGYGLSRKMFEGVLGISGGDDMVIKMGTPILVKTVKENLDKGIIQRIEYYENTSRYCEIARVQPIKDSKEGAYYIMKVFKRDSIKLKLVNL